MDDSRFIRRVHDPYRDSCIDLCHSLSVLFFRLLGLESQRLNAILGLYNQSESDSALSRNAQPDARLRGAMHVQFASIRSGD